MARVSVREWVSERESERVSEWNMVAFLRRKSNKLKFIHISQEDKEQRFKSHQKTVPQYLHTVLTDLATGHINKSTDYISYFWLFCIKCIVRNRKQALVRVRSFHLCSSISIVFIELSRYMFRSYDHNQVEIYTAEINTTDNRWPKHVAANLNKNYWNRVA
jgi:hypothetical protein